MGRIWCLSLRRFRGSDHLDWVPRAGISARLGSRDVGKSTVLDGIALAFSATRRYMFYEIDFHRHQTLGAVAG